MAATQVKFALPSGEWNAVDNSAAPAFVTFNSGTHIGYDTTVPGATTQASNPFADTGSVLIDDSGNDTVYADPQVSTFKGNPVSQIAPTYATVTKVLSNPLSATIRWKNPS